MTSRTTSVLSFRVSLADAEAARAMAARREMKLGELLATMFLRRLASAQGECGHEAQPMVGLRCGGCGLLMATDQDVPRGW